jgi:TolB protein
VACACGDSGGVTPDTMPDGPALEIAGPTTFLFEVEQGRDAPTQLTQIANAGDGTLQWGASASDPWLTARPASGTLAVGEAQDLGISVLTDDVEPGEYSGTVEVSSSDDPGVSRILSVQMTVVSLLSEMQGMIVYASDQHDSSCAVTCPLDIYAMNADGSDVRRLTETAEEGLRSSAYPDVSLDGQRIVFLTGEAGTWSVRTMSADGSNLDTVFEPALGDDTETPSWSPDGASIAFLSQHSEPFTSFKDLWLVSEDGSQVVEVTQNLPWHYGFGIDWSPDGNRLLHPREGDALWVVNVDGTDAARIVDGPVLSPRWSPDGARIAFTRRPEPGGDLQILVIGADGADPTPLVDQTGLSQVALSWSPDGSRIVFQAWDGVQSDLWSVRTDGTGLLRITDTPYNEVWPSWGAVRDP